MTLRFQTNLGFNCSCCRETKQETINHLFIASDLAKRVWQQIISPLGLQLTSPNMENMLDQWWTLPPKNVVHRFLHLITPSLYVGKSWKQGVLRDLSISRSTQIAFATKFSFRLKNRYKKSLVGWTNIGTGSKCVIQLKITKSLSAAWWFARTNLVMILGNWTLMEVSWKLKTRWGLTKLLEIKMGT